MRCSLVAQSDRDGSRDPLQDGSSSGAVAVEAHAGMGTPLETGPSGAAGSLAAAGLVALEEKAEADAVGSPVRIMRSCSASSHL